MAGAPKGNKNAEKWTEETVLKAIEKVHQYNLDNEWNYHLGGALIECDLYPELWSRMAEKFKDNPIVCQAIKKAEYFLESRIINSTMSGVAKSAAMAIFYLKNKHDYKDKSEVDQRMDLNMTWNETKTYDSDQEADFSN